MNQPTTPNTVEEIRELLTEAYGFKSTSPKAQENINAALDLLDSLADRAQRPTHAASTEPVAWMRDNESECTTAKNKRWMENAGFGVWDQVAAKYTIPLFTATQAAQLTEQEPAGWLYGNTYWERDNQRITDHIKQHGRPLYGKPAVSATTRYQWLRDKHDAGDEQWFVYGAHGPLDAAIDAAILANQSQKG